MKIKRRDYVIKEDSKYTKDVREKKGLNTSIVEYPCYMFIDQATVSGVSIFDSKKRLLSTFYIEKEVGESNVEYRNCLRRFIVKAIDEFNLDKIFCEGVFGGPNFKTTELLISIKEMIKDIGYELGVKVYPLNNKKWKSRLASPRKWDTIEDDKKQIERYVKEYYPLIKAEEDVIDSLGMGIAVLFKNGEGLKPLEMRLNKKLPIKKEVFVLKDLMELPNLIEKSKLKREFKKLESKVFDYDITIDLETNFRYWLTNYNVLAISEIPYHKYYGQILLMNNIRPSELGDGVLIGVACRKNQRG